MSNMVYVLQKKIQAFKGHDRTLCSDYLLAGDTVNHFTQNPLELLAVDPLNI